MIWHLHDMVFHNTLSTVRVPSSEPIDSGDVAGAHRPARSQESSTRSVSARHRQLLSAAQDTLQLHCVPQLHRPLWAEGRTAGKLVSNWSFYSGLIL